MPDLLQLLETLLANPWVILGIKLSVLLILLPATLVVGYVELKVMAHIQHRLGPMYPGGFHGWAQTLADGIKFIQKEDIIPRAADRMVFAAVPFLTMMGAALAFVVIPVGPQWIIEDLEVGIFYALAVSSIGVIGVLMAGWASANKYSLVGALRMAGQLIAYELPLVLAAAAVVMQAGSMSMVDIVESQRPFWLFNWPQGLSFVIFMVAATAEVVRPPFDMPIAEAEIITGAFTEYSGMRFAFGLFAAEYIAFIALSALATTLFLGGYLPPIPALDWEPLRPLWFLLKTSSILFVLMWVRWTYPRLREDQLQRFAWKVLVPLSLANIFFVGALKLTPII
ncbi:MAG: NADH-quinone oxidoreductase subunit NuoH [Actinobacteria bacterium]|nr:NADH-quinone oxidoreductase subunit NuoH [Actinomycetota bacterium]